MITPPFAPTIIAEHLKTTDITYKHIHQGHSKHQHWHIQSPQGQWFLTYFHSDTPEIARKARLTRQAWAQSLGLAPETLIQDPDHCFFITDYLPMPTPWWQDSTALKDLIKRTQQLHKATPSQDAPQANSAQQRLTQLWEKHQDQPFWHETHRGFMDTLAPSTHAAWSHQDLHPLNVRFYQGRTWICDWEYAGLGDPAADIMMMDQYLPKKHQAIWRHHFPLTEACMHQHHTIHLALCCLWAYIQASPTLEQVETALKVPPPLSTLQQSFLEGSFDGNFLNLFAAAHQAWAHQIR